MKSSPISCMHGRRFYLHVAKQVSLPRIDAMANLISTPMPSDWGRKFLLRTRTQAKTLYLMHDMELRRIMLQCPLSIQNYSLDGCGVFLVDRCSDDQSGELMVRHGSFHFFTIQAAVELRPAIPRMGQKLEYVYIHTYMVWLSTQPACVCDKILNISTLFLYNNRFYTIFSSNELYSTYQRAF